MDIEILTTPDCPHIAATQKRLRDILIAEGLSPDYETRIIRTPDEAPGRSFPGSPTILINGLDIEVSRRADSAAIACRTYPNASVSGVPPEALIRTALRQWQASPHQILFLCTGNSCRSQMAEGWARQLIPDYVVPYSAGIETHGLNPNAVKVMAEAGVDISEQESTNIRDLLDIPLDLVITVCGHADENCPVFPGRTRVEHVPFDDPPKLAALAATPAEQVEPYRRVRDEIRRFVLEIPARFLNTST